LRALLERAQEFGFGSGANMAGIFGWPVVVSAAPVGGSSLLFTAQLIKTEASTVPAGAIPDSVGFGFKQGDIPSGTWPVFKNASDTEIPFTYWGVNTWDGDGSLRTIKCLFRLPDQFSGATSATYDIKCYSGGSAPSTSCAVSAGSAPDFTNTLTGITALSGTWISSYTQGVTDNNKVRVFGQGPAGFYVGVGQEFMQAGSNHPHLECEHFVMVLQNSDGTVYGTRHIGHIMQPHCDVSAGTMRAFSAVKKVTATTVRNINGTSPDGTTHTTSITCALYSGLMDCGTGGKMDFNPGTRSTEAPLRWKHDMAYWISTKLLPPYDLSITSVNANTTTDYYPYDKGTFVYYDMNTAGERGELAVIGAYNARMFFTQAPADEQVMRATGLIPAGWRTTIRRSTTRKPPVVNNGPDNAGGTYTGLGTSEPTWYYKPANGFSNGIPLPIVDASNWNAEDGTHHRPNPSYVPWMFTGEWQYLDLMTDFAIAGTYYLDGTGSFAAMPWTGEPVTGQFRHHTINGTTYYNSCAFHEWGQPQRQAAWNMRDIGMAEVSLPDVDPAGTDIKQYYKDTRNSSIDAFLAFHALQNAAWQGLNYWRGTSDPNEAPWTQGYHLSAACFIAGATGATNASNYANYLALFFKRLADRTTTFAQAFSNRHRMRNKDGALLADFDDILTVYLEGTHTPSTATDTYTYTASNLYWTPTSGDRVVFGDTDNTPRTDLYYVVNPSANTYQVALTPGGSAVNITDNTTYFVLYLDAQNYSGHSYETFVGAETYPATITGAIRWAAALGLSNIGNALTKAETQMALQPVDYSNNPKVAYKASY
jgi:hypothetical protein